MKRFLYCQLIFIFLFSFCNTLFGQETNYKVEYSIGHYIYDRPNDDTDDDDWSELRIEFLNSGIDIYNETLYFGTDTEDGLITEFDDVITTPNPETQLRYFYSTECPENNWQPFNDTRSLFNGCREDILTPLISIWSPCTDFVHNYSRIVQLPASLILPNNDDDLRECEPYTIRVAAACEAAQLSYALEYTLTDPIGSVIGQGELSPYSFKSSSFTFDLADITGLNPNDLGTVAITARYVADPTTTNASHRTTVALTPRACSPSLVGNPAPNNATCFDSNDGSVTLTFDSDVDVNSDMRYFIYQRNGAASPGDAFNGQTDAENPPQAFAEVRLGSLVNNGDGTFSGSSIEGDIISGDGSLEAGEYYILYQEIDYIAIPVIVKSGELAPDFFEINEPTEIEITSLDITQPQCSIETGEVTLSASGGQDFESGTYEYSNDNGNTWQSNPTFFNLAQGQTYTFSARLVLADGECISPNTEQVSIDQILNSITINPGSGWLQQPSSPTATDGSLRIITNNGSPTYTYELYDANDVKLDEITGSTNANEDFTGLGEGSYYVVVTDSNGCSATSETIVLEAIPLPQLGTAVISEISCFGNADGAISIPISGGLIPYSYEWTRNGVPYDSGSTSNATIELNSLDEGQYILSVVSNGVDLSNTAASVTVAATLNNPSAVVIQNATATDISCFGLNDGSISVTATGGVSYEYSLEAIPGPSDWFPLVGNTIPNLPGGFYYLTIRNENGCESNTIPNTNIFVGEPTELLATEVVANHQDVTTNGGNDGSIEITVSGGTPVPDYTFSWTGPNGFTASTQNISGLLAGNYQVSVTDANNCSTSLAQPITITEPGPLGITSLTPTDVLCNGGNTGSITAVVTGVAPFNYIWERQDGQPITSLNAPTIDNLSEGIYILRLTDASGDPEVTDIVTITEPLEILDATVTPTAATCFGGNDGSIQITALGGTAPYEYAIDDGFGFQASDTFTNLAPRTYAVTVRDANNCVFNSTTIVDQPIEITVTTDVISNVSVAGGTDGAIFITVNDGTAPYGISWSGPNGYINTIEDITGLEAGTYTIEIRDANHITDLSGCYFTQDFVVIEPGPLAITALNPTEVLCNGEATGSITAVVTGTAPFTYVWTRDGDLTFTAPDQPTITNLLAGIYTLTVTDNTVTPAVTQSVTIIEPLEALTAVGLTFNVSCFGGSDGSIQINATGGTAPYTYSLEGSAFQSGNTFPNLISGTYNVTVMDANNCEFIIPTPIIVDQPQEMGLLVDQQLSLSAANAADGAIAITVFGGTAPYTFEWFADNGFTSTDEDIANLAGGNYTLVVRDNNQQNDADGCTYTQDFIIAEPGVLVATITQTVFLECNSDDFGEIEANVQGGVTPYTYEWFQIVNGNDSALVEDTEILGNLSEGEYFVRITDTNSISFDATPVTIAQPDLLEIIVDATTQIQCSNDPTGAIAISVTGGTQPYQYYWSNGEITEDLNNLQAGDYTLEIVDANGCLAEETITINSPDDALQIVNATITNISAYEANDGSIVLELGGGTAPYTIDWTRLSDNTNVGDQEAISNLSADTYEVLVSDANGCTVIQTYEVTQPDIVEETIIQPTCAGESNGSIEVLVNQGNGFFTYSWSTGETTSGISGLEGGSYSVTITGFGDGPITRAYEILDPLPLEVDLGEDRVLCTAQELLLDATVADGTATYTWTSDNGFLSSDPSVLITASGNYTVLVQTQTGCTAEGSIFVDISTDEISADFAVSSQVFVGETLVAVDISYPLPESLEWVLPEGAQVLKQDSDELELTFAEAGEYEIGIITTRGDCIAQQTKKVLVTDQDGSVLDQDTENGRKLIEDFIIYPNPTDGRFTAEVNLTERGNISIKVFSFANNALMASEKYRGEMSYSIPFDLSSLPSGVYAVLLETPYGNSLRKIIVI